MPALKTIEEWPFCQENIVVTPTSPSRFPIAVDITQVFAWAYRVKKWKASFNISVVFLSGFLTRTDNYYGDIIFTHDAADENALACSVEWNQIIPAGEQAINGTWTDNGGGSGTFVTAQAVFRLLTTATKPGGGTAKYLRDSSDNYVPSFELQIQPVDSGGFGGMDAITIAGSPAISLTVDGVASSIYPAGTTTSWTGSVTLDPYEWWEHDPGDGGGPIWDSSDGSELRDPFSC